MLHEKVSLGFFPTPLHKLPNLSAHYPDYTIYIKRDDQTGLASGGNKTRKLEYLLKEAIHQGCDTVLTAGAQQSNHCRQTAAACAALGLSCHLLLGGIEPDVYEGNLLLSSMLGATLHFTGDHRKGEDLATHVAELEKKGHKCYTIPYGGSILTGALGFAAAVKELKEQLSAQQLSIDYIFFASSSGGMQAGLTLGKEMFGLKATLIPINIDKDENEGTSLEAIVASIVQEGFTKLGMATTTQESDIYVNRAYDAAGYGVVTQAEQEAIRTLATTEGILLDPVYSGRAFYGMIDSLAKKKLPPSSTVLFWHTGGLPAIFNFASQLTQKQ